MTLPIRLTSALLSAGLALTLGLSSLGARAESLPLWELGLGVGAISLPDYRGSDIRNNYILPVPYFVYRGELFKADRNGVRSTLFESDHVEVNVSLNATQPVRSKGNPARAGMSDLKPTVELGPTLDVNLMQSPDKRVKFDFRVPVRTSITVESSPKSIGWLVAPSLNLDLKDPFSYTGWNLGLVAGILANNRKYNEYFYSVPQSAATAQRPAYQATGGFSGTQFTVALSKRYPRHWVGGFMRYDTLASAVFDDSPLVKRRHAVSAGVAISWILDESSVRVDSDAR